MPNDVTTEENVVLSSAIPLELRMQLEQQEREQALASGQSPKDVAWNQFIEREFVYHDHELAKKHLDSYIGYRLKETNDTDAVCYELFQNFIHGRNGVKKSAECAEYVISRVADTRNVNLLREITSYYKQAGYDDKAAPFYYSLYTLYAKGLGVPLDDDTAIDCLRASLLGLNIPERREELRNLYAKKSPDKSANKRMCYAYERVIQDGIAESKKDYADYLLQQKQNQEAVHWLVSGEYYEAAYNAVNITDKNELEAAVKKFLAADDTHGYGKSLQLMLQRFSDVQSIFSSSNPASYAGIIWRYVLLSVLYIPYHTFRLNSIAFIAAVLFCIGVPLDGKFLGNWPDEYILASGGACMLLWGITLFGVDLWRRYKFDNAKDLWDRIKFHPQMESRRNLFDDEFIRKKRNNAITQVMAVIFLLAVLSAGGFGVWYYFSQSPNESSVARHNANEGKQETANNVTDDENVQGKDVINKLNHTPKSSVTYKKFTDGKTGISFDCPADIDNIKVEHFANGTHDYSISLPGGSSTFTNSINVNTLIMDYVKIESKISDDTAKIINYIDDNSYESKVDKIDDKTFVVYWEDSRRTYRCIEKYCYVTIRDAVKDRLERRSIKFQYSKSATSAEEVEIGEHIVESFNPGA